MKRHIRPYSEVKKLMAERARECRNPFDYTLPEEALRVLDQLEALLTKLAGTISIHNASPSFRWIGPPPHAVRRTMYALVPNLGSSPFKAAASRAPDVRQTLN